MKANQNGGERNN